MKIKYLFFKCTYDFLCNYIIFLVNYENNLYNVHAVFLSKQITLHHMLYCIALYINEIIFCNIYILQNKNF